MAHAQHDRRRHRSRSSVSWLSRQRCWRQQNINSALAPKTLQTFAFVTLLFGSQGLIYVLRERRHMWSSMPSKWVFASSAVDIGIVAALAFSGTLMAPLPWRLLLGIALAAAAFALVLDQIKRLVMLMFRIE